MKKHGTCNVPTITGGRFVRKKAKVPATFRTSCSQGRAASAAQIQDTFAKAYKAG